MAPISLRLAAPALAILICGAGFALPAAAAESAYTALDNCKSIPLPNQDDPAGGMAQCPGRDGFTVFIVSGDDRSWLVFKHPAGGTSDLIDDVMRLTPGEFPSIRGKLLEWRSLAPGGPAGAVIFRVGGADPVKPNGPEKQALLVARVTKGHQVQVVTAVRTNEEARRVADGLLSK